MKTKRWIPATAGTIIMVFAGLVYAWSVLSTPLTEDFPSWSASQLSLTFTICMMCFCLGGLIAGIIARRTSVKINLFLSALLFATGFYLSSQIHSIYTLYISYGVFCGLASGISYNTVMSTVIKWFPDKIGTISGILLMGFGIGSMAIGSLFTIFTPPETGGWRHSFIVIGVLLALILIIGSFFINSPKHPLGKPGIQTSETNHRQGGIENTLELTPRQMLKRPSFWLFFMWATLLSAAGLALISQSTPFATAVGPAHSAGTIAFVAGLISIFNGIGRVVFGSLHDLIGIKQTMLIITISFILSTCILIIVIILSSFPMLIFGYICMGFSYGGITPTNSAFVRSFYGKVNYPVNFSIVNMVLLISSFGGTLAGLLYDISGSYMSTLITMIISSGIGFICLFGIKKA